MSSNENVIEVSFKQQNHLMEDEEFLLGLDDPLEELMNEFDEYQDKPDDEDPIVEVNKAESFKLKFTDSSLHMTDVLIKQMTSIRDDLERLSYYLDEINIEG